MNKLVVFDLDGTICDTVYDIEYCLNQTLKHFGYPTRSEEQVRDAICAQLRELIRLSMEEKDASNPIIDESVEYYQNLINTSGYSRTILFKGIEKVIPALKKLGYKVAILTNKDNCEVKVVFEKLLKDFGFDKIVGLDGKIIPKPNPTELYNIMAEFGVSKEETYFVGDGDTDVQVALNAGVNLIAVTYGYRDKEYLQGLGATTFAQTPEEILSTITKD